MSKESFTFSQPDSNKEQEVYGPLPNKEQKIYGLTKPPLSAIKEEQGSNVEDTINLTYLDHLLNNNLSPNENVTIEPEVFKNNKYRFGKLLEDNHLTIEQIHELIVNSAKYDCTELIKQDLSQAHDELLPILESKPGGKYDFKRRKDYKNKSYIGYTFINGKVCHTSEIGNLCLGQNNKIDIPILKDIVLKTKKSIANHIEDKKAKRASFKESLKAFVRTQGFNESDIDTVINTPSTLKRVKEIWPEIQEKRKNNLSNITYASREKSEMCDRPFYEAGTKFTVKKDKEGNITNLNEFVALLEQSQRKVDSVVNSALYKKHDTTIQRNLHIIERDLDSILWPSEKQVRDTLQNTQA